MYMDTHGLGRNFVLHLKCLNNNIIKCVIKSQRIKKQHNKTRERTCVNISYRPPDEQSQTGKQRVWGKHSLDPLKWGKLRRKMIINVIWFYYFHVRLKWNRWTFAANKNWPIEIDQLVTLKAIKQTAFVVWLQSKFVLLSNSAILNQASLILCLFYDRILKSIHLLLP